MEQDNIFSNIYKKERVQKVIRHNTETSITNFEKKKENIEEEIAVIQKKVDKETVSNEKQNLGM